MSKDDIFEQKCRVCKVVLTSDNAWISRVRSRFQSSCKSCSRQYANGWLANNKDKERSRAKSYYHQNKAHLRQVYEASRIKRKYGITTEQLETMYKHQNGKCAICLESPKEGAKLCIDHCHLTGRVRGLLCKTCNTLLGNAKDKPSILSAAIAYLENKE